MQPDRAFPVEWWVVIVCGEVLDGEALKGYRLN